MVRLRNHHLLVATALTVGCGGPVPENGSHAAVMSHESEPVHPPAATESGPSGPSRGSAEGALAAGSEPWPITSPAAAALGLDERWTDDLSGLIERRIIRALVPYSKTHYFIDSGRQRGVTYEALRAFEGWLNKDLDTSQLPIHVLVIPTSRNRLLPDLRAGRGDIAAGNLTVTPLRSREVAFTRPFLTGVRELVVTGPSGPPLQELADLSGKIVFVRASSSYHESLTTLNERFVAQGLRPMRLSPAPESLEDEDILEMASAALVPITVVDEHKATLWARIFPNITVHEDFAVREGGAIAWALRRENRDLKELLDRFVPTHRQGTLQFNVVTRRYLESTRWIRRALDGPERGRHAAVATLFDRYGERYGFDPLLLTAQAYQESGLDNSQVSRVGAVGVMQLLPSTAASPEVNIAGIQELEPNIHAGVKYLRWIADTYFDDPAIDELNRPLFALAAYNAGPNRIQRLRGVAAERGLDPNVWFRNVELIAAEAVGRQPVDYVGSIYKYYAAYRLAAELEGERAPVVAVTR